MKKYRTRRGFLTVDIGSRRISFENKDAAGWTYYQSATTSEQKSIEDSPLFGTFFELYYTEDSNDDCNLEECNCETLEEAKRFLMDRGVHHMSLKTKDKILVAAERIRVRFTNAESF